MSSEKGDGRNLSANEHVGLSPRRWEKPNGAERTITAVFRPRMERCGNESQSVFTCRTSFSPTFLRCKRNLGFGGRRHPASSSAFGNGGLNNFLALFPCPPGSRSSCDLPANSEAHLPAYRFVEGSSFLRSPQNVFEFILKRGNALLKVGCPTQGFRSQINN